MISQFLKYCSIGVLNTLLHWLFFLLSMRAFGLSQAPANLLAFFAAVSFSFVMNARYTFRTSASVRRYLLFTCFMGLLSYLVGLAGDRFALPAVLTLLIFSGLSLLLGFLYSKFLVFRAPT